MTAGISLIEVIISVTVLGVGLLGLLAAFPRGVATEKQLERATVAGNLAQAKLEELASLSYGEIGIGSLENNVRVSADPGSPFYHFKRTTASETVDENLQPSATDEDLKKITVTVSWAAPFGGDDRSVEMVTIVTKR